MPRPLVSSQALRQRFDLYLALPEIEQIRASAKAARLPMSTYLRRVSVRGLFHHSPRRSRQRSNPLRGAPQRVGHVLAQVLEQDDLELGFSGCDFFQFARFEDSAPDM